MCDVRGCCDTATDGTDGTDGTDWNRRNRLEQTEQTGWMMCGLFFNFTMLESHFLCLILIHQEIDGLAFVAEFSL